MNDDQNEENAYQDINDLINKKHGYIPHVTNSLTARSRYQDLSLSLTAGSRFQDLCLIYSQDLCLIYSSDDSDDDEKKELTAYEQEYFGKMAKIVDQSVKSIMTESEKPMQNLVESQKTEPVINDNIFKLKM